MIKKLSIVFISIFLITSCSRSSSKYDLSNVNVLNNHAKEFDFSLHSYGYMLVDMADFDILYSKNEDVRVYPASLTKLITLDTVLHLVDDLDERSYVTDQQVEQLIKEDASLAYIQRDYFYSIRDLLYALNLPSGADAALALENYFSDRSMNLVDEMNKLMSILGCEDSRFVNTTGLHDDNHYTSINDLFVVVMDILKYEEGRKILTSLTYMMDDGLLITSGIRAVSNEKTVVLGGKTGYTPEAGQNIVVLYRHYGQPFLYISVNAMGSYLYDTFWHFDDALKVFEELY